MDFKFTIKAWQDKTGSENAKISVGVGGATQVASQEISSTDIDNPTVFTFEATGLETPGTGKTHSMVVTLLNDEYVDASNDRNVYISPEILYTDKADGTNYKHKANNLDGQPEANYVVISDFTNSANYRHLNFKDNSYVTAVSSAGGSGSDWQAGYTIDIIDANPVTITLKNDSSSNVKTGVYQD